MYRRIALLLLLLPIISAAAPPPMPPAPEPWHSTADPTATFSVMLSPGVAPAVIHVNGIGCPLPVGTPLTTRYDWEFGDPDGKFNTLTGFNAAHLYDQAGHYTIKLTVTDQAGTVRTATAKVAISANVRKQLFVSPTGSDRNAGTTPDAPLRSLGQAFHDLSDGCEIRLRANCTFDLDSTVTIHKSDVLIGRYDTGANPVIMFQRIDGSPTAKGHAGLIAMDGKCNGVLIERITIDSPFGVADDAQAPKVGMDGIKPRGRNITFREVTFNNIDTAINSEGSPVGMLVQECRAPSKTGLRAYLVWGEGTDHVYLGNMVANSTREHCVRLSGVERVLIFGNDFTNLDRRPADPYDYSKGAIEMHRGSYAYIAGNTVTGGAIRVGPRGGGGEDKSTYTDWAVIENNKLTGTQVVGWSGAHHIMARNNVLYADGWSAFDFTGPDGAGRTNGDITIAHNTVIDNGPKGSFLHVGGHVDGITVQDNLFVAPHLVAGKGGGAVFYIDSPDLADFRAISHNVWPAVPASTTGGEAFVIARQGRSIEQWKSTTPVSGDIFANVTVDGDGVPTSDPSILAIGDANPAAPLDGRGKPRPSGHVTVGAVEIPDNKKQ